MTQKTPDFSSKFFTLLRAASQKQWQDYTDHQFVHQLGNGTLPKAAFLHYLKQDYVYLHHYARAWALGVFKARTLQETHICADVMHGLAHMELPIHVEVCAREGIDETTLFNTKEEPATLAYTRYILDCGQSGDFLDLLTALVPCALGYGEIGLNLSASLTQNNPYQEWIDTYAGSEFQQYCHTLGKLLDQAARDRIGEDFEKSPRWPQLCEIFNTSTKLETDFWQMGSYLDPDCME